MHTPFCAALLTSMTVASAAATLAPRVASAQLAGPLAPIDPSTSRPVHDTPIWVEELEGRAGVPPCDGHRWWGRSTLDGSLAARARPEGLPCRSAFERPIRFELGLSGGGQLERGDGGVGALSLSLGLRFAEYLSVYYQLHLLGGGWTPDGGVIAAAAAWNAVLIEVSPHPRIGIALGPSIDITAECRQDVAQTANGCGYMWSYGLATRLSVPLVQVDSTGIVATADFHVSVEEPDPRSMLLLGVGFRL